MLYGNQMPNNASAEMRRIYYTLQSDDYEVFVIDNAAFEKETPGKGEIMVSGRTETSDKISVHLDDTVISAKVDGQWFSATEAFRKFYGKSVNIKIMSGTDVITQGNYYIPKRQIAKLTGEYNEEGLSRQGASFTWTPDKDDPCGKIFLRYMQYDQGGKIFGSGVKILENNGSYKLDEVLSDPALKRIDLDLISGNWIAANLMGRKLVFSFETVNYHEYKVQ
jgi:hypothetical protein